MHSFNWHVDTISPSTLVNGDYKNTQNVRRFLRAQCGEDFKFDRSFMQWIIDGSPKSMGDVAKEWRRRHRDAG